MQFLSRGASSTWKTALVVAFALLLLAEIGLVVEQERSQRFAARAQKTGSALIDFAETHSERLQRRTDEALAQYEQRIATETDEAESLYARLYAAEVARLRDGFAQRGLTRPDLDEFYKKPGSIIAIREIGKILLDMGTRMRLMSLSQVVKARWRRLTHLALLFMPPDGQSVGNANALRIPEG